MTMATSIATSYDHASATSSVADLLSRIGDGEPAAWDEIYRQHKQLVYATVRSFRLQEADALDAVQMTWLRLAENAHRIRFPERLGGWLATTARHECCGPCSPTTRGPTPRWPTPPEFRPAGSGPHERGPFSSCGAGSTNASWTAINSRSRSTSGPQGHQVGLYSASF